MSEFFSLLNILTIRRARYTNCLVATLNARRPSTKSPNGSSLNSEPRFECICGHASAVDTTQNSISRRQHSISTMKPRIKEEFASRPEVMQSFQLSSLTRTRNTTKLGPGHEPGYQDDYETKYNSDPGRAMQVEIARETMASNDIALDRDDTVRCHKPQLFTQAQLLMSHDL